MKWFRLYSEARNDAKLRTLTDAEHRTWFNLLCYAAEQKPERGEISDFDIDLLAIEVAGGDSDLLLETLKKLSRLRIVHVAENSNIRFLKFEERQYDKPSDRPARVKERVHAHRERAGKETPETAEEGVTFEDETPCNAMKRDETRILREYSENTQKEKDSCASAKPDDAIESQKSQASESDTDSLQSRFGQFWQAYPKKRSKGDAQKAWKALKPDAPLLASMLAALEWQRKSPDWRKDGGQFVPFPASYLRARGWEDSPDVEAVAEPPPKIRPFTPPPIPQRDRQSLLPGQKVECCPHDRPKRNDAALPHGAGG